MTDQARAGQGTAFPDPLPVPRRARWQPLRAGLVDVFYYDDEEFRFHDGRLPAARQQRHRGSRRCSR